MRKAILPLMHEDSSALMWSYTNQITEKSKKEKKPSKKKGKKNFTEIPHVNLEEKKLSHEDSLTILLSEASEEELVVELAKRRAKSFSMKGSLQSNNKDINDNIQNSVDQSKQSNEAPVCSLNGGPGTIPCYELME